MNIDCKYTVTYPNDSILLSVSKTEDALLSASDFLKGQADELRKPPLTPRQEAIIAYANEKGYDPISVKGGEYYEIRTEDSPPEATIKSYRGDSWGDEDYNFKLLHSWVETYYYKKRSFDIKLYAYKDVIGDYTSRSIRISPIYS